MELKHEILIWKQNPCITSNVFLKPNALSEGKFLSH